MDEERAAAPAVVAWLSGDGDRCPDPVEGGPPCIDPDEDCAWCWSAVHGLTTSGRTGPTRGARRGGAQLWTPEERAARLHRRLPGSTTPVRRWAGPELLRGRHLRYVLLVVLMRAGAMSVAELVVAVEARGHRIGGRPGKVVSDALRWERRRNRVVLLGRGRYRVGTMSRQVKRRMVDRVAALEADLDDGGDRHPAPADPGRPCPPTAPVAEPVAAVPARSAPAGSVPARSAPAGSAPAGSAPPGTAACRRPPLGIGSRWLIG